MIREVFKTEKLKAYFVDNAQIEDESSERRAGNNSPKWNRSIFQDFCHTKLRISDDMISEKIFSYFDVNRDSMIGFMEFCEGLESLMDNEIEAKIKCDWQ
ncbi:MAG: EF-hand calcium-binding domain-containing protein 1 [Marteilia pararefringens]